VSYEGPDRRKSPCKEHEKLLEEIDHQINGNGKPGLRADVDKVLLALYGDETLAMPGMISKQQEILLFIKPLKPFLNTKLLTTLFTLSILACIKVLGTDLISDIIKVFIK
jgi:hypothetical protein